MGVVEVGEDGSGLFLVLFLCGCGRPKPSLFRHALGVLARARERACNRERDQMIAKSVG